MRAACPRRIPACRAHPHHSYPLEADWVQVLIELGAVTEVVA